MDSMAFVYTLSLRATGSRCCNDPSEYCGGVMTNQQTEHLDPIRWKSMKHEVKPTLAGLCTVELS